MRLAFPQDSKYKVDMLTNICDTNGKLVYHGFLDKEVHARLECPPERTAFTRMYKSQEVIQDIIDHGGGRFWADEATMHYILDNGMIVTRYSNNEGKVVDNFPTNPNGSMLNIESITNLRGNLKIGMCHNERKLNALSEGAANYVFASMREYIEDGCPDLSGHAKPQDIPINLKSFSSISAKLDPDKTLDIYIKMLTDDNERTMAQLFLGDDVDIDRRRLLRIEVYSSYKPADLMQKVITEIASLDFFDGIMLKKDLPYVKGPENKILAYEVVGKEGGTNTRSFTEQDSLVEGFPVTHEQISLPNPEGYAVHKMLWKSKFLSKVVKNIHTGMAWFFRDEQSKQKALEELLR